jgi:hypothetical protein
MVLLRNFAVEEIKNTRLKYQTSVEFGLKTFPAQKVALIIKEQSIIIRNQHYELLTVNWYEKSRSLIVVLFLTC